MQTPRVLTFNWHDPYLHMFAQTGFDVLVGDWMHRADGTTGWDLQKRPLPENLTLLKQSSEAAQVLRSGGCDVVICHTLQDLAFVAPFDVPTVYLTHNALQNDGMNDRATMVKLQQEIGSFLKARNGVFAAISNMKRESWGLDGFVVRPGINLEDYGGYTGEDAVALSVGNLFVERDHMLGFRYIQEILQDVPGTLVGENPNVPEAQKAESWDTLKAYFRKCRVYVNATVEEFEDGYNLGMLEAMATGMPVVCTVNITSPIVEGENGYISNDTQYLRERVLALLEDADLAKKMGDRARETVSDVFSVGAFVENWQEIVTASMDRFKNKTVVDLDRVRRGNQVDLETPQDALYPYEWADVEAFLAVDSLDDIAVAKLKLDRMGAGYLCDIFLGNKKTGQTMAWQGLEVFAKGNIQVQWPSYLGPLDAGIRQVIEGAVQSSVEQVEQGAMGDAQSIHVNLGGGDAFEFRVGEDRVTPGDARSDIYLHHAKRYTFARQFCYGKTVVDLGSGAGYGAKLLRRDAERVVGLDLEPQAQQFANSVFGDAGIRRLVGDIRAVGLKEGQFDVAVCFEAMEHVREHDALLGEIRRLLKADGTLVISTPNKKIYDLPANANEYHVGMLELDEFEALLNRYYEDVAVYGQMRAGANQPFYDAFNFRDGVDDGDEVFVAVCKVPRADILTPEKPKAPAVHVKAPVAQAPNGGRRLKVLVSHVSNPISMGRYYVDAFRQAHDVITCGPVIDADELKQWREAEEQHAFKSIEAAQVEKLDLIGRLAQPCDIPMQRGQVDIAEVLNQLPKGWQPDLMMWVDSATGFLPMGLEKLDCPTVCLSVDTHTGQSDWRMQYAKLFSHTYLVHNQFIDQFKAAGCPFVGWLPSACAPEIHGQIPANKSYDIGFIGQTHRQWHPHRVRLLDRLIQAQFDVHIESKILQEMALFNSRSKIVFNRSLNGDLNMRVFESLCSGSMLLTDRLDDNALLNDLFKDREHLVMYDDDNLEALVRYYLDHDDEREAIAAAGRTAVLDRHTYAHRADQVISEVIAQSGIARCVADAEGLVVSAVPQLGAQGNTAVNALPRGAGTAESAIAELAAYTGEPLDVVRAKLPNAGELLTEEWRSTERKSEVAVDAFYKETEHFIYDLTHFNYANMYMGWRGSVYNLCQQVSDAMPAFEVLDYGGGIGTSLLELSDLPGVHLTYADLPGKTYDYANWRFQQRGLDVTSIALGGDDPLAGRVFDVIVCMEVIEHLVEPEQVVQYLIDHLKPGGLLILTVTFYAPEPDMMHLNLDRYTNEGFYEIVQNMGMQELTKFSPRMFKKTNQPATLSSQLSNKSADPTPDPPAQGFSPRDPHAGEKFKQLVQSQNGPIRLNLGCGEDRRAGYINVDAYVPTADLQMDIFDLQMDDGMVDEVFSSHMLEHLGKYEVPKVLTEWHRVLKPGGRLCLNLPDLEWCMAQWLRTPEEQRWGWALDTIYGLQTHDGEYHKTGFTVARAEQLMEDAGFANVKVSWTWSHGMRCLWVEAVRPEAGKLPSVMHSVAMDRFDKQFPVEISELVSYSEQDVANFFKKDWQVGLVSFEKLPMDSADLTLNMAVVSAEQQMILQGIRVFGLPQNPFVIYPDYLKSLTQEVQQQLNKAIGDALGANLNDANYKDGDFVVARFGKQGDLGLEQTDACLVPGLAEHALYMAQTKQYMLAERFAAGARVLDAGCGTGSGAKRLSQVAAHVDAVDLNADAIAFAKKTYDSDRIAWSVGDVKTLDMKAGPYDLVTSFGVVEHLDEAHVAQYLDGIARALRAGGVALVSVLNVNRTEQTLDKFDIRFREAFADVTWLGQTQWSDKTEVSGQCVVSGRVTDDDRAYVAVCVKREVSKIVDDGFVPKVSIVMPLYNKAEFTEQCLKGLEDTRGDVPFEVILVDNGSADNTSALLDGVMDKAEYRVVRNGENLGFSRGNNVGAQVARGEYLLFLNNDTVPHEKWLDVMVAELDHDASVGIVGAKLLYPDTGKIQHAGLELVNGAPDHVHRHADANAPEVNVARDLDMVTGACLLIRKEVFDQLDGFDEAYINGVEDVDLCLRVRDLGYRVRYTPQAVVDHYEGTSDGRYDHVRPNLERFVKRWNGHFDANGRFIPKNQHLAVEQNQNTQIVSSASAQPQTVDRSKPLCGIWEGTQFVYHSLSIVNMALTSELIKSGNELKLVPYEPATFGPEKDPERYGPLAERMNAALSGSAQFHVRHQWPPNFTPPEEGHWVMIQPWEFGQIPQDWVQPMQAQVDEIWVPSNYVKQCYIDSGVDADRVQVIPNGVRTDLMHPKAKPLKLDTDKTFKFLFVGGTIFRKGIDILLKVYHQTFSASDDVCLVIKGMGDDTFYKGQTAGELIKQIKADPEGPEILYLTDEMSEEELAGLYTACDCLVHPYRGEGFGMPVAEAMSCALPVVVTAGGACDDFCNDENAYFVSAKRRSIKINE